MLSKSRVGMWRRALLSLLALVICAVPLLSAAASAEAGRQALAASCINMFIDGNVGAGVSTGTLFDGI